MIGPFRIYQVLLIIVMVLSLIFMYNRMRNKKATPATFALSIFLWLVVLFFAFAPRISDPLAGFFGFDRGLDLLIIVAFGIGAYCIFRLYIKIDNMNQDMTELVREIAIRNEIELDDETDK